MLFTCMKLKHFVTLIVTPLILTIAVPHFRGDFDVVAPATISGLVSLWVSRDKVDNGKHHS